MPKKRTIPELKVVFDTSVLYTQVASDLLRHEVSELINEHSAHADLSIKWYLPKTVRDEREYQMSQQATQLLPSLQKLERILGHNLNITQNILAERITSAIDRQINDLGLGIIDLNVANVDWAKIVSNSVFRQPPFEAGENEKGFRDAIITEIVVQLVNNSPSSPAACRVVLVSNDQLLIKAVKTRAQTHTNVMLLSTLEELKSLINTLVSTVSEEFVASLQKKADIYFFDEKNKAGLYYKFEIRKGISSAHAQQLEELPQGALIRENDQTWILSKPRFLKKEGKRVFWSSRLTVRAQSYFLEEQTKPNFSVAGLSSTGTGAGLSSVEAGKTVGLMGLSRSEAMGQTGLMSLATLAALTPKRIPFKKGESAFDVSWSATVKKDMTLISPKLEKISFAGTTWE